MAAGAADGGWPVLVGLFAVWYVFGALANVYCKEFLRTSGDALSLTLAQYAVGAAASAAALLWRGTALERLPSSQACRLLAAVALANGIGHVTTNASMAAVAVSFAHTVKAAEPLFSVALSALLLRTRVSRPLLLALLCIVIGTAVASVTELSYSHMGMLAAMASNLLFSLRNTVAKRLQQSPPTLPSPQQQQQQQQQQSPWTSDSTALFLLLSAAGAALVLPVWVCARVWGGAVGGPRVPLLLASACHCLYNLTSFAILARVSPVTHAIGNAMRRLFIIAVALLWFHNPVTATNIGGTALACAGVVLYAQATHWLNSRGQRDRSAQQV